MQPQPQSGAAVEINFCWAPAAPPLRCHCQAHLKTPPYIFTPYATPYATLCATPFRPLSTSSITFRLMAAEIRPVSMKFAA